MRADPTKPSKARLALIIAARAATYHLILRQKRLLRHAQAPQPVQERLLFEILKRQASTAFGRDHGFSQIRTVADYRKQVPVAPYERLQPYIDRMKRGDSAALLADDQLLMFALTSGTTAARKLIPITRRYLNAYSRGWNLWGIRAYRDHRERYLALRPIVQMVGDPEEYRTEAGTPCGNASGFAARIQRRLIRRLYVVPPEIGTLKEASTRYYVALRASLGLPVALFSAANPSTLVALGRSLEANSEKLIKDLAEGTLSNDIEIPAELRQRWASRWRANPMRARELETIANQTGRLRPVDVWPAHSTLLATWTGGSMTPYLSQLPAYYGPAPIRDLGLVASEGRFTIPFTNDTPAGILDLWSHYYEFIPEQEVERANPTVLGAHEVVAGETYAMIPTTVAGLYRYDISDMVRVVGFEGRTPLVEFVGKGKRFSNLTGEKLSESQVTMAMNEILKKFCIDLGTYSLLPAWQETAPGYVLACEATNLRMKEQGETLARFTEQVDQALRRWNIEYDAKRASGRLTPLRLVPLPSGTWQQWDEARLRRTGGSPEQYKHPVLIGDLAEAQAVLQFAN